MTKLKKPIDQDTFDDALAEAEKAWAGYYEKYGVEPDHVRVYLDGFVPNAYKYRAPGRCLWFRPDKHSIVEYDRKRSHGDGPRVSIQTANGGYIRWT
jgi:hypothetical protein